MKLYIFQVFTVAETAMRCIADVTVYLWFTHYILHMHIHLGTELSPQSSKHVGIIWRLIFILFSLHYIVTNTRGWKWMDIYGNMAIKMDIS